ncbi:winged helix-turn-helix domain-containing protein [Mesorhizobium koreense]|jgi:two-component system OmpR family response regulator|uniref:winged helix-turn-helix domain-containing protein n=1 Tax=Mesorhizobium koreense TaxID=3074855 RepID=UPI00287BB03F|nr:winged helix-turn-helix domain-containing protein [Mesorhizobium sp. WR6]
MRLLLIEDDAKTANFVSHGLSEEGHVCDILNNGQDGLFHTLREQYDVVIVDRMVPDLDGLSLVKALRSAGNRTPVLFLTAVGGIDDRVEGLEAGGDDYLVKPFAFAELLARVNALSRRPPAIAERTLLQVADLSMDLIRRRVTRGGKTLDLQPRELALLEVLMRADGRVLTRTMLLDRVWGINFDPGTSVVESHISRLRAKIDKPFRTPLLHTIRNTGYALHAPR